MCTNFRSAQWMESALCLHVIIYASIHNAADGLAACTLHITHQTREHVTNEWMEWMNSSLQALQSSNSESTATESEQRTLDSRSRCWPNKARRCRRQFRSHIVDCLCTTQHAPHSPFPLLFTFFFGLSLALAAVKLLKNLVCVCVFSTQITARADIEWFLFAIVPMCMFCANTIVMAIRKFIRKKQRKNSTKRCEKVNDTMSTDRALNRAAVMQSPSPSLDESMDGIDQFPVERWLNAFW